MTINEAVLLKLKRIQEERGLSINAMAMDALLTRSTVQNILKGSRKCPRIDTLYKILQGQNIELAEFFSDDIFKDLDTE